MRAAVWRWSADTTAAASDALTAVPTSLHSGYRVIDTSNLSLIVHLHQLHTLKLRCDTREHEVVNLFSSPVAHPLLDLRIENLESVRGVDRVRCETAVFSAFLIADLGWLCPLDVQLSHHPVLGGVQPSVHRWRTR